MDSFKCNKCPKAFDTKKKALKHENSVHDVREFICSTCEKTFVGKNNFITHAKSHIAQKCEKCGMLISANSRLLCYIWMPLLYIL